MKALIKSLILRALESLEIDDRLIQAVSVERPRDLSHGDFTTNAALVLARPTGRPSRKLAEEICQRLPADDAIAHVEIAGPGFVNVSLSNAAQSREILHIVQSGKSYGCQQGNEGKIIVEFVSANPTGPLHVGHGRGAAVGDSICRLLEATGWSVHREYYYNDAGNQIETLAQSVQARCHGITPNDSGWPADGYQGTYVSEIANAYLEKKIVHTATGHISGLGDPEDLDAIRKFAVEFLRKEQDLDLMAFGVHFDQFFLESSLYSNEKVSTVVSKLIESGYCYERDGALWLKSTAFGDDKDRVMRKQSGDYTYFIPDVAYHVDKWERGFKHAINEQGADHHSTVTRVRAGLQALNVGIPADWPEYVLHQMVTVVRNGNEVKISKRAGSYVTLRDLIDEVGSDATRYFLLARKPDSQLTFDLDLARSKSNDNPVYYIQYACARISSVFNQLSDRGLSYSIPEAIESLQGLSQKEEELVMRWLTRYPEVVLSAAEQRAPQMLCHYLLELAHYFHTWYNNHTFLADDAMIRTARLTLALACKHVLANGLYLLGVTAPEKM